MCVCKGDSQMGGSKGSECLQADFFFGSVCSWFSAAAAATRRREEIFSLTKSIFTAQQQQLGEKLQKCLQSKLRALCVLIT